MSSSTSSSDQQARRFSAATEALVKASINVVKVEQSLEEMKAMKVIASFIDSKIGVVESSTNSINSQMISVESNTASINSKMVAIESNTSSTNDHVANLEDKVQTLIEVTKDHDVDGITENTASVLLDRMGNLEKELNAIVVGINVGLSRQCADIAGLLRLQRVNHVI